MIFGAQRPGYSSRQVHKAQTQEWITFIKNQGIKRVCCLLPENQLAYYFDENLLDTYQREFGEKNVCWAPIEDFHLCKETTLSEAILPFLQASDAQATPAIVHCSGGLGRTGHVLAAWLVFGRGFGIDEALVAVKEMGRNPKEAVSYGNATEAELHALLMACRRQV